MGNIGIQGVGINEIDKGNYTICYDLANEDEEAKRRYKSSTMQLRCLERLYPREFSFPNWIEKHEHHFVRPSYEDIYVKYHNLVCSLEKTHEAKVAPPERRLHRQFAELSKKQVLRSVWIGSHCVDLFVPNVRSVLNHPAKVMRGFVVEVDGDSHNYEDKMKKDERKGIESKILGIGVTHIENWDFNNPPVKKLKASLMHLRPLDSRERKRLWTRIMVFTLAIRLNKIQFFQLFKQRE